MNESPNEENTQLGPDEFDPAEPVEPAEEEWQEEEPTRIPGLSRFDPEVRRIVQTVRSAMLKDRSNEQLAQYRQIIQDGSIDEMRSLMLDQKRVFEMDHRRKRISQKTAGCAAHLFQLFERLAAEKKNISKLQSKLEQFQKPEKRANLDMREQVELQQTISLLKERIKPFHQFKEKVLQGFEQLWHRRYQELAEESGLKASLEEYLKLIDPRIRARLETEIRQKTEEMNYESRVEALKSFVTNLVQTSPAIAQVEGLRLIHLAEEFLQQENFASAIDYLEHSMEYDLQNPNSFLLLADCCKKRNDLQKQLAVLRKGVQSIPNDGILELKLAECLEQRQLYGEALAHYQQAWELGLQQFSLLSHIAKLAYETKQWKTAIPYLQNVLNKKPDSVKTLSRLGAALIESGETERGIQTLKEALLRQDNDPHSHYFLALGYRQQGHYRQAYRELAYAHEQLPNDLNIVKSLAQLYFDLGEFENCAHQCRKLLEKEPNEFDTRLLLSQALRESGELDEAVSNLQPLLEQGHNNETLLLEYGQACLKAGKEEEAYQSVSQLLEKNPQHNQARHLMGLICTRTARFEEAMQYMQPQEVR